MGNALKRCEQLPQTLTDYPVHLVGIKGTGMCALAEYLKRQGAQVSGSDTEEVFYTDAILDRLGIRYSQSFAAHHVPPDCRLLVYSSAYTIESNPELQEAARRGLPATTYPQMLGLLSQNRVSVGVSGVHGKTTTTGMAGTVAKALGLPASVIVGSALPSFGDSSCLVLGDEIFLAETCEYRRNFLSFSPSILLVTSVELDHPDYFRDRADVEDAFVEYGDRVDDDGVLVFCRDDAGAARVAERVAARRPGLSFVPYGLEAEGAFRIEDRSVGHGRQSFRLRGFEGEFDLVIPGVHNVLNATAVVAVMKHLCELTGRPFAAQEVDACRAGLLRFRGSRRRSEVIGEAKGILVLDDYAHHPTAIRSTLLGFREFYAGRRLVVDFMPHTFSRTAALLEEFAAAFAPADALILHRVYASARESVGPVGSRELFNAAKRFVPDVRYVEDPADAVDLCHGLLRSGDIFLTMGAGDNWKLGLSVLDRLREGNE